MRQLLFVALVLLATVTRSSAQERFRLDAPNVGASANAVLTESELVVVDQAGKNTVYLRDPQFDSQDGQWLGYFSRSMNQVIRWPVARAGNMQIGDVAAGSVRYRTSQMVIQALDRAANRPVLPPPAFQGANPNPALNPQNSPFAQPQFNATIDPNFVDSLQGITPSPIFDSIYQGQETRSQMLQLATFDPRGSQLYLTRDNLSALSLSRNPVGDSNWWVVPTGNSYVRVQHYQNGRISALSATRSQALALAPISQDPRQLWRVSRIATNRNRFVLENAMYSGQCMASNGGQLLLQPINYAPSQWWVPMSAPTLPNYEPFWRTVSQEVHANSPLTPAQLGLVNSHRTALVVLLADQRQAGNVQQIRIEPGQSANVTLDRDPGATIVESYEIRLPSGVWDRFHRVCSMT
jgi:hypothetical protein